MNACRTVNSCETCDAVQQNNEILTTTPHASELNVVPVTAIESVRTAPTQKVLLEIAKIVYVMDGSALIETAEETHELRAGQSIALGAGRWCSLTPIGFARLWTIYVDESFLRAQMGWALPFRNRVIPGAHPHDWRGQPLVVTSGIKRFRRMEALWRQLSAINDSGLTPERVAARAVALFARAVEFSVDALLSRDAIPVSATPPSHRSPLRGRLTDRTAVKQSVLCAEILRTRMSEPWTVDRLAREVALSRTHLNRVFTAQHGVAPIRYLTEIRLTEFTRLVEETDLTIAAASCTVGWTDSRIAARWFRRRFGLSPSEFRRQAHPIVGQ